MEIEWKFKYDFRKTFVSLCLLSAVNLRGVKKGCEENQVAGMAVVANIHNRAFEYKDVLSLLLCTTRVKNSTWEFQGAMPSQNG